MQRPENEWCISDGVTDPNAAGATVAVQIRSDPTLEPLASLPVGFQAERDPSPTALTMPEKSRPRISGNLVCL